VRITRETPIVLGSASPRRRELLSLASVPFVVRAASADESPLAGERPHAYLERVARAKLEAVRAALREAPAGDPASGTVAGILVADTIVVAPDGAVLGKPTGADDGRTMIERLSGRTHTVETRFLLAEGQGDGLVVHAQTVTTGVTFRSVGNDEARLYAASGEGRDKAGGYGVQGSAAIFVVRIDGSYTNVVGLPLSEVVVALRRLGWLAP
jgi:septum formation protein